MDKRAKQLADLILDYSIKLKKGDRLLLQYDPVFMNYGEILARGAKERGANVRHDCLTWNPDFLRNLLTNENYKCWDDDRDRRIDLAGWCTTRILVDAQEDLDYAKEIPLSRVSEFTTRVIAPYKKVLYREKNGKEVVRWNICAYPSKAQAKLAGMSYKKYSDLIFSSCLRDWTKLEKDMQEVKVCFDHSKLVEINDAKGNHLQFSLASRAGKVSSATHNMPSGEVFYGPEEDSIEGKIYFAIPSLRDGQLIQGVTLDFRKGEVVSYSAEKNQAFLDSTLNNIRGSKRVGEFGIGCNYGIFQASGNLILDEKIGGTIHLALGKSISTDLNDGGGKSDGDTHWDLVCDLRPTASSKGGEIYVDGKLVQSRGMWIKDIDKYYKK